MKIRSGEIELQSWATEEAINCHCGEAAILKISWTDRNPGRRFYRCSKYGQSGTCNFFDWYDLLFDEHCNNVIRGLLRRIREMEEKKKKKKQTSFKLRWVKMVLLCLIVLVFCVVCVM